LDPDLRVRRSDVLSAWRGWRPLAVDPHAEEGAPASRDHVISENPETGVIFIAGGKWTTWREMAEHVIDKITDKKCTTKEFSLLGGDNWTENLPIKLVQKHSCSVEVARHLAKTYGTNAHVVCEMSRATGQAWPKFGVPISGGFPYIESEVEYACREYACTVEDVLSRRTRLAFLNKDAALHAVPRVTEIMQRELGWSDEIAEQQRVAAVEYLESYGGPVAANTGSALKTNNYRDLRAIFTALDEDKSGFLDREEIGHAARALGMDISDEHLNTAFQEMDVSGDGRVKLEEFEKWWNESHSELHKKFTQEMSIGADWETLKKAGGGAMFG